MAASNYSVNITLNTSSARNSLQALEKRINTLRRNLNEPLKIDSRVSKIQEKIAKSKDAQKASMIETRRLGDQVQKLADKGLKVDKARAAIRKAAALDSKNQLKAAASQRKIAQDELKLQTDITEEIARRTKLIASGQFAGGKNFGQIGGSIGPALPPGAGGTTGGGRGFDFQSALISGGFPLLFGQGPFVGAAGALGGGFGGMFGQMGGFAGGITATAAATAVQSFTVETGKLGAALNDATKDVEAVSAALGITGTEFEKQLQTLQKLGGEEAAFEAARQKMINLVGQEGVTALQNFGKGVTDLSNEFTKSMTMLRSSLAEFIGSLGVFERFVNAVTNRNLRTQASKSTDPKIKALLKELQISEGIEGAEAAMGRKPGSLLKEKGLRSSDVISEELLNAQKLANKEKERKLVNDLLGKSQKQRVDKIQEEIALLERTFHLNSSDFEIEKQILEMKKDGGVTDDNELRRNLRLLEQKREERRLAEETAQAFKDMAQTISTDIADGIQGMIRGTSTLNDVLSNVLNKLIDASFNMALFGNTQGSLGGGGLFGSVLGGLGGIFGGDKNKTVSSNSFTPSPDFNPFEAAPGMFFEFAKGGRPPVGRPSIVGEKGPELFVPDRAGTIIPNNAMGSTNIVVNVDASGSSVESDGNGQQFGEALATAIQLELVKQKRSGGLLA